MQCIFFTKISLVFILVGFEIICSFGHVLGDKMKLESMYTGEYTGKCPFIDYFSKTRKILMSADHSRILDEIKTRNCNNLSNVNKVTHSESQKLSCI